PNLLLYSPLDGSGGDDGGDDGSDGGDDGGDDGSGDDGSGTSPCSSCATYTGSLSGSGDSAQEPDGSYYAGNGSETGYLEGPSSADFDLYLYRWNGWNWSEVDSSTSADSSEEIDYSGSSGYYLWVIESYSGSGNYTFYLED
ncbi:MAG: hypothetical protein ACQETP_08080, partial [Bacteroidota bacterium]